MITSKVSKKGLVNIPSEVRKRLKIEEGDILVWTINPHDQSVTIKIVKNPAKMLRGKYNDPELAYEKVEETADKLIEVEANANNRT